MKNQNHTLSGQPNTGALPPLPRFRRAPRSGAASRLRLVAVAVLSMVLAALAPRAQAATVAADNASNYGGSAIATGSTGGTGFGSWTWTASGSGGNYIDTSGTAIAVSSDSWGFYAYSGGEVDGLRPFTGTLSPGQVFSVDLLIPSTFGNGTGHSSGPGDGSSVQTGFELRSGTTTGTTRFRFYYVGNSGNTANCEFDDSATGVSIATGGIPTGGFRVVFKLLTADTYEFSVIKPNTGAVIYSSGTRTLTGTSGSGIGYVDLYNNDDQLNGSGNVYFNSLFIGYDAPTISAEPSSTTTACQNSTASFSVTGSGNDGSTLTYAWRRRGSGFGHGWTFDANSGSSFLTASGSIDSSANSKSWGLQQTTVGTPTDAIRIFPAAMANNQSFSIDMANSSIASGGGVGFGLQDSSGNNYFEFLFNGGASDYYIHDSSSTTRDTGIPFTSTGVNVIFTLTSSTTYTCQIKRYANGATTVISGTLLSGASGNPARVRLWVNGAGGGNNCWYNNLFVAGADDNAGNYSGWSSGNDFGQKALTDGSTGNGSSYSGSATASFSITSAQPADGSKSYDCMVMSGQGYPTNSSASALTVHAAPVLSPNTGTPTTLPTANNGQSYSQTISASGGSGSYTFAVTSGTLPTGLSLSTGGVISGTATVNNTYTFTVTATDGSTSCTGSQQYSITVQNCPTITIAPTASSVPSATVETAYAGQTFTASGGSGWYTFTVLSGSLPTGLSLSSGGVLSGTPSAAGTFSFTILATDSSTGCTGTSNYSITATCPTITVSASPGTVPSATVGTAYAGDTFSASGGLAAYTYSVSSGSLPTGITLSSSSGAISGTPTASGTYNFTITATDADGCTGSQSYSITATCPTITVSPATLPNILVNVAYSNSAAISASGGTASYTFAVTSGGLPTGLTLTSGGILSGTATISESTNFTITATDAHGCTGSTAYSVTVGTAPTIATQPAATAVCSNSTAALSVTGGGSTPLSYAWQQTNSVGWGSGNSWSFTGSGGKFVGSSTGNDADGTACNNGSDINSASGNALGLFGPVETATRTFPALSAGQVFRFDVDNGGVDTGATNGLTLETSGGTPLLAFYFKGGQSNYKYWDSTGEHDSGIGFLVSGLTIQYVLGSGNTYLLVVSTCTGVNKQFSGSFAAGSIAKMLLINDNTSTGSANDCFFNNFDVGGYRDSADNYVSGGWTGNGGEVPISGATSASYTTPDLGTNTSYDVVEYSAWGETNSAAAKVTVNTNPFITTASLPGGNTSASYSQALSASGGTSPYTYSVVSGNLPGNLTLSSGGVISGTPTNLGTFNFTVQVQDSSSTACATTSNLSITITCGTIAVSPSGGSPTTLPTANDGQSYSQTISASGGTAPITFGTSGGTGLPSGITLSSGGVLSGSTPSNGSEDGTYTFTVTATDANGCTGTQSYSLIVATCPAISLTGLTGGTVGSAYSQTITASGGSGSYTYTVLTGTLPTGLSLSSGGVLSGTPTAGGTYNFTVLATDTATGCTGSQAYSIAMTCPTITFASNPNTSPTLPGGTVPVAYVGATNTASGGTAPYTYSVSSGTLPNGLALNSSSGAISGTPTNSGTFNFTITATDADSCTGSSNYSITISCPTITVSPAALPFGVTNVVYSSVGNTNTAGGGTAPYTFSVSSGSLPTGLSLSTAGVISGTPTAVGTFSFTITATDKYGCTGSSSDTINVGALPTTTDPAATTNCSGSTASFSVTGGGSTPLGYAWRKRGVGWGTGNAWTFVNAGNTSTHGYYIGDSTACGGISPGINSGSDAMALYANNGDNAEITRNFGALQVGQSVVLDYQNPEAMSASGAGTIALFSLRDSSSSSRFEFYFNGGDAQYTINDANTLANSSGIPFTKNGLLVVFTLVTADTYNLQVTDLNSGKVYTYPNRSLSGTPGNALSQLRFFFRNSGTGGTPCQDFFVNSIYAGGYSDGSGNYTAGSPSPNWVNGSNLGQGPLASGTTATGSSISGQGTSTLSINNVQTGDAGTYDVVVWNGTNSTHSSATTGVLTVHQSPAITNAPTLTAGTVGTSYSATIGATGGTTPYAFTTNGNTGTLPPGLALSSGGILSGTPTNAGTYTFTVVVTDSSSTGCSGTSNLSLTINCPTITVSPSSGSPTTLPTANDGQSYSQTITASGGTGSYTFAASGGTGLPSGITLSSGGVLSGSTPSGGSEDGTYTFTVTATDGYGCTGSQSYSLVVATCPTISLTSLTGGTVESAYSQTVTASGGTGPYNYSVLTGSLPTGLSLGANDGTHNGQITGTPTASGTYNFTILATDSTTGCTGSQGYSVTMTCPTILVAASPADTSGVLPGATAETAYGGTIFSASGGTASYTYSVSSGSLPNGLALNSSSGALSGTPTNSGTFTFTITATDADSCTGSSNYSLTITCPTITVSPATLPNLAINAAYTASVTASGGVGTYTFAVTSGGLPTGMSLSSAGVFSGTPTVAETTNFTITATDGDGCEGSTAYTETIGTAPVVTTQPASSTNCLGSTATFSVVAGTGTTPLSYVWRSHSNTGWGSGNGWSFSGSGGSFLDTSTDNDADGTACGGGEINDASGKALGLFGAVETATRSFTALTAGQIFRIDMDNGGIDTGRTNGVTLETSGGTPLLAFYFKGGQSNYKYWDSTGEHDTGIGFTVSGLTVQYAIGSGNTYLLVVKNLCGDALKQFTGAYAAGSIAQMMLINDNAEGGNANNLFFNNIYAGGFTDGAINYSGSWTGNGGEAPISGATSSSYTTPALQTSDNGDQFDALVYNAYGVTDSSAATNTLNTPPTPGSYSAGAPENTPLVLSTAKLLVTATDIDGYALSVTAVSSVNNGPNTSTNGGTVVLSGDESTITYTPASNYVGPDSFDYTITDTCTNVLGTIYITVTNTNAQSKNIVAVTDNGNGTVTLTLAGVPGFSYHVQGATSLDSPITWVDLSGSSTSAPAGGVWNFTDPFASNYTTRFYRTVSP